MLPGKGEVNVPHWPCCGHPSGSCRFWPPSDHILVFYPTLWQSSPCISPKQRTTRCHSCSAGLMAWLQRSPVSVGLVGRRTKLQELEDVHWNKNYSKNNNFKNLTWKENLHLFAIDKIFLPMQRSHLLIAKIEELRELCCQKSPPLEVKSFSLFHLSFSQMGTIH